jgi:hypothetical protein
MARWSQGQKGARPRQRRAPEPLPAPLPTETRTVGQLIAESIKLYGQSFWRALPLGIPLVVVDVLAYGHDSDAQTVLLWAFAPLFALAYVWASLIVTETPFARGPALAAFVAGVIVFVPFPLGFRVFVIPGIAILAMFGLAVPAALVEDLDVRDALKRGFELGRADPAHAVGGLASVSIVYFVCRVALQVLLHAQGDQAARIAVAMADLVLGPLVFLGGALLYFDQKARLERRPKPA